MAVPARLTLGVLGCHMLSLQDSWRFAKLISCRVGLVEIYEISHRHPGFVLLIVMSPFATNLNLHYFLTSCWYVHVCTQWHNISRRFNANNCSLQLWINALSGDRLSQDWKWPCGHPRWSWLHQVSATTLSLFDLEIASSRLKWDYRGISFSLLFTNISQIKWLIRSHFAHSLSNFIM